jgi:large subunit ribosomal protein L25
MSESMQVNAQARDDEGKGASRRLRRQGLVPGIVYGGHKEPKAITVRHNELVQQLGRRRSIPACSI